MSNLRPAARGLSTTRRQLARCHKPAPSKHELLRGRLGLPRAHGRTRTLDTHACRLRNKLTDAGHGRFIENVWGVGYRLVAVDPGEREGSAA